MKIVRYQPKQIQRFNQGGGLMSLSFRPVKEVWGEHSSCFVDADLMLRVLLAIATEAGSRGEAYEYGDKTSIWVEDGGKLLDFI